MHRLQYELMAFTIIPIPIPTSRSVASTPITVETKTMNCSRPIWYICTNSFGEASRKPVNTSIAASAKWICDQSVPAPMLQRQAETGRETCLQNGCVPRYRCWPYYALSQKSSVSHRRTQRRCCRDRNREKVLVHVCLTPPRIDLIDCFCTQ